MTVRIFSYGTLQLESVQRALFGRLVAMEDDVLTGYAAIPIETHSWAALNSGDLTLEEFDELYRSQNAEADDAKRIETIKQMQEIIFRDSPYLVTAYNTIGEAFRNDRFACFQPQPDPGGILLFQYGVHNYLNIRPTSEAGDCDGVSTALGADGVSASAGGGSDSDEGSNTAVLIVGGIVLGALVVGLGFWALLRRSSVADRE